ncbi:histidine utilization repressor [Pelagibius sp. Alg239-R121]|uniref:histidine utilization repressor n=1 Tax=Pelagibius sp. Alg239-R121 TaxID=2993448 RepID=UPI0024A799EE|nr:histidine utilization repressor [Pelagibius sp. Alg239-R121]
MTLSQDDNNLPAYQQVKDYILKRVLKGDWPEGERVPSENELTRTLGFSRMTVNRALRELTSEGWLTRTQGAGTFVAESRPQSAVLDIRNIADEIRERGHEHRSEIYMLRAETSGSTEAGFLGLEEGSEIFHSLIVHYEDGRPVQLEDRYVNPAAAPDYLNQDFRSITPYEYLVKAAPLSEAEHVIQAIQPDAETARLLSITPQSPCLLLKRRTWSGDKSVTFARLIHPGDRYQLWGRFSSS